MKTHYDYIIVGSGSAGSIIAARLSENSTKSVLLIEAGQDYKDLNSLPNDFKYGFGPELTNDWWIKSGNKNRSLFVANSTDEQNSPMLVPRGKVVGGSSAVNAQIFLRGDPGDYDSWGRNGNDEWSFEKCLPQFIKIENDLDFSGDFHGQKGPIQVRRHSKDEMTQDAIAFDEGLQSIGFPATLDHNDPDSTGVGPLPFNTINRIRQNAAICYLNPIRSRKNLHLKSNSFVQKIIIKDSKAIGVEVTSNQNVTNFYSEEIIISAGAIGSPHLLLLSGIGPEQHLKEIGIKLINHLPGVGKNLRDHPQVNLSWKKKDSYKHDKRSLKRGITVGLRYTATGSNLNNDMLIHHTATIFPSIYFGSHSEDKYSGIGMIACLYLALGSGELKLRDPNPFIQPLLNYNYFQEEEDLRRMRECVRLGIQVGESNSYSKIVSNVIQPSYEQISDDKLLNHWIKQNARTSHHVSGTCKLGPDKDTMAVVDQYGKVRGVKNLRIADASIMPDCVRANTNLPTMMIAEKIAQFISNGK